MAPFAELKMTAEDIVGQDLLLSPSSITSASWISRRRG